MIIEIIGGIISGSLALLADAVHMLTDAFALGLAASAQWLATRPADHKLQFGYRRFQVLAAFVNGLALLVLLAWIFFEAFSRLTEPEIVQWQPMLIVAILGLIANGLAFMILHPSGEDNINIRGALLHVISDLVGSVVAVIAAIVIALTNWTQIDPILSCIVAVLIAVSAIRLIRETGHILLEGAPNNIDRNELIDALKSSSPDIVSIDHLKLWLLTPDCAQAIIHVRVQNEAIRGSLLKDLKQILVDEFCIIESTIQIDVDRNGSNGAVVSAETNTSAKMPSATQDSVGETSGRSPQQETSIVPSPAISQ